MFFASLVSSAVPRMRRPLSVAPSENPSARMPASCDADLTHLRCRKRLTGGLGHPSRESWTSFCRAEPGA